MTKYSVVLAIKDMASAKSDVNGPKKSMFLATLKWKGTKTQKKCFNTYKPSLY